MAPWPTDNGWRFGQVIIFIYLPAAWCFPLWVQIMRLNFAVTENVFTGGDLLESEALVRLSDSDPVAAFGFVFLSHWWGLRASNLSREVWAEIWIPPKLSFLITFQSLRREPIQDWDRKGVDLPLQEQRVNLEIYSLWCKNGFVNLKTPAFTDRRCLHDIFSSQKFISSLSAEATHGLKINFSNSKSVG